jgi:hypothetical protein
MNMQIHEYVDGFHGESNWDSLWMGCLFDLTIPMTDGDNAIGFEVFIYHLKFWKPWVPIPYKRYFHFDACLWGIL